MSMQVRLVLTILLSVTILVVYGYLRPAPAPPAAQGGEAGEPLQAKAQERARGAAGAGDGVSEAGPAGAGVPGRSAASGSPEASEAAAVPTKETVLATDVLELRATNTAPGHGGLVSKVRLRAPQFEGHPAQDDPFDLGAGRTFEVRVLDLDAEQPVVAVRAPYGVVEEGRDHVVYARQAGGVKVTLRLSVRRGYAGELAVEVENRGPRPLRAAVELRTRVGVVEDRYDVRRGLCRVRDDLEAVDKGDAEDGPVHVTGDVLWGGSDGKYFTALLVPARPMASCEVVYDPEENRLTTVLRSAPVEIPPAKAHTASFGWYVGAKELERLQAFDVVALSGTSLEEAIDWGYLGSVSAVLGKLLLRLLRWLHALVGSWGLAILLLTGIVKLVTLPLTLKQMASMRRMKEIQPEIEKIKKKYADDRVRQGQEMQALFARSGVHPLAGCLPMLIQIPVWFALYSMLLTAVELVHQPFLWLPDLTKQDPYFILPVAIGAAMYLQNRMMPNTMDEAQARMMRTVMPIMFTAIMLFLPAGLGVYILTNIVLSAVQTAVQMRGPGAGAAAGAAG